MRVRNVDDWMEAIAVGRGVGLTPASTGRLYTHPQIRYRLVADSPRVPITLAWPRLAAHPLVADFVASAELMRHATSAASIRLGRCVIRGDAQPVGPNVGEPSGSGFY